jgi:hypothetical protein
MIKSRYFLLLLIIFPLLAASSDFKTLFRIENEVDLFKAEYDCSVATEERICFDSNGNALLASYNAIQKLSPDLKYIRPFILRAKGLYPEGLSEFHSYGFDPSGNLIACNRLNRNIMVFNNEGKEIKTVKLDKYPNQVFANKQGDFFLELNNLQGDCRFEKVDRNFKSQKCLLKESGKSILNGFVLRAFSADFDDDGNVYFIDGVEYKVNVCDRNGKNLNVIGKAGGKFTLMTGKPPYPVDPFEKNTKFDKWWDSWCVVSDIFILKNKYLLVFFRCERKIPGISPSFLDVYSLDGKKIETDIAVPKGHIPIGRDTKGNIYFNYLNFVGYTANDYSNRNLVGAKLMKYSLVLK